MTGRAAGTVCIAVVTLVGGGCGTVNNLHAPGKEGWFGPTKGPRVYGGVTAELALVAEVPWEPPGAAVLGVMVIGLFGIDFPLTVVGDTLTLPLTVLAELRRARGLGELPPVLAGEGLPPDSRPRPDSSLSPIPDLPSTGPVPQPVQSLPAIPPVPAPGF